MRFSFKFHCIHDNFGLFDFFYFGSTTIKIPVYLIRGGGRAVLHGHEQQTGHGRSIQFDDGTKGLLGKVESAEITIVSSFIQWRNNVENDRARGTK